MTDTKNLEYCVIKLFNGEDIISQVSGLQNHNDNIVYLTDPYLVKVFSPTNSDGYQQIAITKWNPYTNDERIALSLDNVLTISNVKPDLLDYYRKISYNESLDNSDLISEPDTVEDVVTEEETNEAFDRIVEILKAKRNTTLH